jgi:sporulation protein YlmC with PRC-barrel domain
MRATELLGSEVVDVNGRSLGPVRDLRITPDGMEVVGIVVGGGGFSKIAHAWGYAEGRTAGPWLLKKITASAVQRARLVPVEHVEDWGPGMIRLSATADVLASLWEDPRA